MLASLFTAALWLIGHLSRDLRKLGAQSDLAEREARDRAALPRAARSQRLRPHRRTPRARSRSRSPTSLLPLVYAAGYATLVLIAATWIFERRDFR